MRSRREAAGRVAGVVAEQRRLLWAGGLGAGRGVAEAGCGVML